MHHSFTRGCAVAAALMFVAASCGDDTPDATPDQPSHRDPDAQPAPGQTVFTNGEFDEIPIFRGATPAQRPSTTNGTTTGSFITGQGTPETAIRFYEDNLPALGWTTVDPVVETSDGVWRGDWMRDGRRLQVIASDASPRAGDATQTQIDLVLLAGTADVPVATVPDTHDAGGSTTLAQDRSG